MINSSLLILGRQPALGLAELESLFGADKVALVRPNVAKVELGLGQVDFSRLGGSTRLANPIIELPVSDWVLVEKFFINAALDRLHSFKEGKLKIGVSAYGFNITPAKLMATTLTLKKAIREKTERSVRIVPNQTLELNTAQLEHNGLVNHVNTAENYVEKSGREFLLVNNGKGGTIVAETIQAQDIGSYTLRDRGRPNRDARVGMLPPKLAQIIINLAGGRSPADADRIGSTYFPKPDRRKLRLLDPFCGTGVILQEALLLGYGVYGTDVETRMIDYSRRNLEWFTTDYFTPGKRGFELAPGDATNLQWRQPIDLVASEAYLGRPFSALPSSEKLEQVRGTCNVILEKFLANIRQQIKPATRLCLAVPAWQEKPGRFIHLPLLDHLENLGYNRVRFEHVRHDQLLYYREDQVVARELLVITRI